MTDQPLDRQRTGCSPALARRWLAVVTAAVLLAAIIASPWTTGSGAQPGPDATLGTPGTPVAPVVIRASSHSRTTHVNGTPVATATLPTEPEQGTPVPPATAYSRAAGGATVPDSSTGHELRLYRLTIVPGATFDLPESTGWTIVGFSGTVTFYSGFAGFRSDDPITLTTSSETGGPPAGTFQNLSAAPAVVWVIGVSPTGTPDPVAPDGVELVRIGQVALVNLTPGAIVSIHLSFSGAGPVAQPLDPAAMLPDDLVAGADGSVPAGIVFGVQGSVQVTDAASGDQTTVDAGQSVSLPDLTGRAVTGPAQRATDPPNQYIVVSAREQAPAPSLTGTLDEPVMPGTPAPATPGSAGSPAAGDVVTCDAAPRTGEQLRAAIERLSATPTLRTDPFGRSVRPLAGTGAPADEATVAGIQATMDEYAVCGASGNLARAFGLVSDNVLAFFLSNIVSDLAQLPTFATARPVSSGVPTELVLSDVEVFADGRAGALVYGLDGAIYVTFVPAGNGSWLIDAFDQTAGQPGGPGLIAASPAATPPG